MQRLFSMFPKGAPGVALLLLRVALGVGVVEDRWAACDGTGADWTLAVAVGAAVLLMAGLLTPMACAASALADIGGWIADGRSWHQMPPCLVLVAIALALLGPGAYSLDGRAFGRRKVIFPPDEPDRP